MSAARRLRRLMGSKVRGVGSSVGVAPRRYVRTTPLTRIAAVRASPVTPGAPQTASALRRERWRHHNRIGGTVNGHTYPLAPTPLARSTGRASCSSSSATGSSIVKVEPTWGSLATLIVPPIRPIRRRQIASPSPAPL